MIIAILQREHARIRQCVSEHRSRRESDDLWTNWQVSRSLLLHIVHISLTLGNSGKSTLISALLRLLDPLSGTISIDGMDISTIPRNELRSLVIAIPQDLFLLPGSIRFNLDPTGRATDSTLLLALERCNLLAVVTSRGGLDEELTSASMSQGEQRLFALAVALVRKWNRERHSAGGEGGGGILILDEATSGTDAATHALMQQVVDEEFRGYTVLQISHRPDEIRGVDRMVEMKDGRVVKG